MNFINFVLFVLRFVNYIIRNNNTIIRLDDIFRVHSGIRSEWVYTHTHTYCHPITCSYLLSMSIQSDVMPCYTPIINHNITLLIITCFLMLRTRIVFQRILQYSVFIADCRKAIADLGYYNAITMRCLFENICHVRHEQQRYPLLDIILLLLVTGIIIIGLADTRISTTRVT